ncbi:MAG: ferritin [Phycisphaerales bacterium]|nr:ferritin [Phycisphaerales bacterium]
MTSNQLHGLLNAQISHELGAELQYLAMACWASRENLSGVSGWFMAQAAEEHGHAMKILAWMEEWDMEVKVDATPAPTTEFDSLVAVFEAALAHEQRVTSQIHEIYALAGSEGAWAAQVAFQWFVTEQVEEEATARDNLARVQQIDDNAPAVLSFDRHLAR